MTRVLDDRSGGRQARSKELTKGARFRSSSRRGSWVRIPPPALKLHEIYACGARRSYILIFLFISSFLKRGWRANFEALYFQHGNSFASFASGKLGLCSTHVLFSKLCSAFRGISCLHRPIYRRLHCGQCKSLPKVREFIRQSWEKKTNPSRFACRCRFRDLDGYHLGLGSSVGD